MAQDPRQRYYDEYIKNEIDANRQMIFANLFGGIVLLIIWVLYLVGVFPIRTNIRIIIDIIFPILILVLVSPLFYLKSPRMKKPGFKYFVVFSFLMVVAVFNVVLPKHGVLGWALCLLMVNHYYNPKFGRSVFIAVLVSMLICLYMGMFLGEFDPYLIGDGILDGKIFYPTDSLGNYFYPDTPTERFEVLHNELVLGENRYLKIFTFYFIPRTVFITLIFMTSNSLNRRTYKLLVNEIKVNSEQEKISTELNVAKDIQIATLPSEFVTNKDVEILAQLKAAKEVGGDFYDYFNLGDDHVAIVIGDVSGKGIPAAMFMMKTITCFKNYVSSEKAPSQILREVNKTIYEGNANQMFVTCFLAIVNTKTGLVKFANAGHNPPIVGQSGKFQYLKCHAGFILGCMPDSYAIDEEFTFEKGDSITLYTDGITEARNMDGEFYGEKRLLSFFNNRQFTSVVHLHHELKDDVSNFVGEAEQSDDMTFLTLKFHGDEYYYSEKLSAGTLENIPEMLKFIGDFCDEHELKSLKNNLLVVGDELISNIVKYGYKDSQGDVFVRLLYNVSKQEIIITIIDTGIPFNQFEVNNSPIEGDITNREEGGLGILIVKNIMTEYAYDRIYDKNIITLKKKI